MQQLSTDSPAKQVRFLPQRKPTHRNFQPKPPSRSKFGLLRTLENNLEKRSKISPGTVVRVRDQRPMMECDDEDFDSQEEQDAGSATPNSTSDFVEFTERCLLGEEWDRPEAAPFTFNADKPFTNLQSTQPSPSLVTYSISTTTGTLNDKYEEQTKQEMLMNFVKFVENLEAPDTVESNTSSFAPSSPSSSASPLHDFTSPYPPPSPSSSNQIPSDDFLETEINREKSARQEVESDPEWAAKLRWLNTPA